MQNRHTWLGLWIAALCVGGLAPAYGDIETVVPAEGTIGTEFLLTGFGFGEKRGKVQLGEERCKVVSWSDTRIVCQVAIPQPPGDYAVMVTPQGSTDSMTNMSFTISAPWIAPAAPFRLVAPGEVVTITGESFGDKKGDVYLQDTPGQIVHAKVRDWSMGSISFEIPKGLSGILDVGVVNEVGLDIQRSWGTLTPVPPMATLVMGDQKIADGDENGSGVFFDGKLWVFYANKSGDLVCKWYSNSVFVANAPQPGGSTYAQVVPVVAEHELWLFMTGQNKDLYFKKFDNSLGAWENTWWHFNSVITTDNEKEIAPVWNPRNMRFEIYYWNTDNTISWLYYYKGSTVSSYGHVIPGVTNATTAPSAVYWQPTSNTNSGVTLLSVGANSHPTVYYVRNGTVLSNSVYTATAVYGRPFVADLGEDYVAQTWVAADRTLPYARKMDKKTGRWSTTATQPFARESDYAPNAAINYEWADDASAATGKRWNANVYLFWGRKNDYTTSCMMSYITTAGWWTELGAPYPITTDLSDDQSKGLQLWPVIGVVDAPPFVVNGDDYFDVPPNPGLETRVDFGITSATTTTSKTSMEIGPYIETGEKSPVKVELSFTLGKEISSSVSTEVSFDEELYRSTNGNVMLYCLAPVLEVHKMQWHNPADATETNDFIFPTRLVEAHPEFLRITPTDSFAELGIPGTFFDNRFPLHHSADDWARLYTYTNYDLIASYPEWFQETANWDHKGESTLGFGLTSTTNITTSAELDFKVGVNIKGYVGFGVEGSFKMSMETETKVSASAATHICDPWFDDPKVPNQIDSFSVEATWLEPNCMGYWVPRHRQPEGDKPWFITYSVRNINVLP